MSSKCDPRILKMAQQAFSRPYKAVTLLLFLHSILLQADGVNVDEPGYALVRAVRDEGNSESDQGRLTSVERAEISEAVHR